MTDPVQTSLEKTGSRPPVLSECQSDSSGEHMHELAAGDREWIGSLNVSIQAIDTDTMNSQILYDITKVEDIRYKDLFDINETTGEVILKQPFSDILTGTDVVDDFIVKLTIQAMENNTGQMSENITLHVTVIVPETTTEIVTTTELPTTVETTTSKTTPSSTTTTSTPKPTIITTPSTPSPTQAADNSSGDNTTDILIIVIPVIAGILILVFILVYIVRYRRNKATLKRSYRLKHGQRNGYVDKEKSPSDGYDNVMKDSGNTDDRAVEVDNPEYQGTETEKGE
ncbi:hypothetical protein FSP39_023598 [Pinctada imbricata]|uniref:Cadherin domain-containing protein n=1 Tax=Pinctada imbricata TaxID=66713 RepID=A0AA88XU51_PINIB|nr:hypothetical protein FSP39_023598 [Pinctada imbricata]